MESILQRLFGNFPGGKSKETENKISESEVPSSVAGEDTASVLKNLQDVNEPLKRYKLYKEHNSTFKVIFDAVDDDGTFTRYENGLLLTLPASDVRQAKGNGKMGGSALSKLLVTPILVSVSSVDEDKNEVILELPESANLELPESAKAVVKDISNTIQNSIMREITLELNAGRHPKVWGTITKVTDRTAVVDIFNQGIKGIINNTHWQPTYLDSLKSVCRVGDCFEFEVGALKKEKYNGVKQTTVALNRLPFVKDAWEELNFSGLKSGGAILVTCMKKPEGKTYWWGSSDRVPGINIMGNYTTRFSKEVGIVEGFTYVCKIRDIGMENDNSKTRVKHIFTVVPYNIVPEDAEKFFQRQKLVNPDWKDERISYPSL